MSLGIHSGLVPGLPVDNKIRGCSSLLQKNGSDQHIQSALCIRGLSALGGKQFRYLLKKHLHISGPYSSNHTVQGSTVFLKMVATHVAEGRLRVKHNTHFLSLDLYKLLLSGTVIGFLFTDEEMEV